MDKKEIVILHCITLSSNNFRNILLLSVTLNIAT